MEDRPASKSTVTLYYQQRDPYARAQSAREARVPVGPGVKNMGSQIGYAYDERPALNKPGAGAPLAPSARPATASPAALSRSTPQHASPSDDAEGLGETRKVLYFDGKSHHIVDAPADKRGFKWKPPHLNYFDLVEGSQLGVRETPGAIKVKLVGSKHRYLPTMEPAGTSMWSVTHAQNTKYGGPMYAATAEPAGTHKDWYAAHGPNSRPSTARDFTDYSRSKFIGHREYEAASKMLNGVGSWERTQQNMLTSMSIGRPSRQMGAAEHSGTLSGLSRRG